jgi:hypothetical protein
MAIVGVEGKVLAPDRTLLTFQIRHSLDFDCDPPYRMRAFIKGQAYEENIEIEKAGLPGGNDDMEYFRQCVSDLTEVFQKDGAPQAMVSFLSLKEEAMVNGGYA